MSDLPAAPPKSDSSAQRTAEDLAQVLPAAVKAFVEPFAEAEKFKAAQETERVKEQLLTQREATRWSAAFGIVFVVAVLSVVILALVRGQVDFAKEIAIAVIAFAGGYSLGKGRAAKD